MKKSVKEELQNLYEKNPLEAVKLQEGARSLLEFFELLIEEDLEQKRKGKK
jgi:hypothetical protein